MEIVELRNIVYDMKNSPDDLDSRCDTAEEKFSEFEDSTIETTQIEAERENKVKNNEEGLNDLWNNIKLSNIHIIRGPQGERLGQKIYFKK